MEEARESRVVVVTGVSSGIGFALAEHLVKSGYRIFGSVRKQEDADRVQEALGQHFTPLIFDVCDEAGIANAAQQVRTALNGKTLDGLINNAGTTWFAPLLHLPVKEFQELIDINLVGPFRVTQAFLPLLGTDLSLKGKPGRILNISSMTGKIGVPFLGAYTAAKQGLEGMSESLRRELIPYGIDVIIVGPDSTKTEYWDRPQTPDVSAYEQTSYSESLQNFADHAVKAGRNGIPVDQMARNIVSAFEAKSAWTRYSFVKNRLMSWTLPLTLPVRWVDKAMADRFELRPLDRITS